MKPNNMHQPAWKKTALAAAISGTLSMGVAVPVAQGATEEVIVTGIRGSLKRAMDIKRDASGVVDSISAEDVGKFPDLNVAESLQRITGVSIDRSGGEGQSVTVRGLGPDFNTVLLNGRQLATDSQGRAFSFDVLSADLISGADVYKSTMANLQEGGIGATINISTARPLDSPGLRVVGSVKGMYETLSEDTSPSGSLLISNTFADDTFGILVAASHQERKVQINRIETAGWRPGQTISNNAGDSDPNTNNILFTNAFIPRNWDQIVDEQERTRDNAALVLQFAPNEELTITLDGFISNFEVDSLATDLASWFEPDRVGSATIAENGTLTSFTQEVGLGSSPPATDFVSHTRNRRDTTSEGGGINVEYAFTDKLTGTFDLFTSTAENDRAGQDRFNVVGIINNYTFDNTGGLPTVAHDGFGGGNLPDPSLTRLHYNEKGNRFTDEDEITEFKADFEYTPDTEVFQSAKFGFYRQEREKSSFQIFGNQCEFCGYGTPADNDAIGLSVFQANNFFGGLIDTWYTYNGDAMVQFLADEGFPIVPTLQNNRYTINEDITSLYMDFTFGADIGDMPLTVNFGVRYAETDIETQAVQSFISDVVPTSDLTLFSNVFEPATDIKETSSYSNLNATIQGKLEVQDDMVVRFAVYDSMTRAFVPQLSPATVFNEPRRQNLTASGGNPNLQPYLAENWDLSFEWYYGDASVASFAVFSKDIQDFIITLTGEESFTMSDRDPSDGFRCSAANEPLCAPPGTIDPSQPTVDVIATTEELNGEQEVYRVRRPQNGETASIQGYEAAITHVFENGFGISANATFVDANISLGADTETTFALEGLGDSQNLILFYEAETWQARIAFNNREAFLRSLDNGSSDPEPVNTERFGQWDISGSYDINDNFTVFFEGINITEEELRQNGRFGNQPFNIEDNGARYAVGVRGSF